MEFETQYPIRVEQEVSWGEQDKLGHVNNTVYFRYFENSRIAQFEKLGLKFPEPGGHGFGPILATATCEFLKPIHFPDRIRTETGICKLGRSSFLQLYRIYSYGQQDYVATGTSVSVYYDYAAGKSAPIPDELRQAILELEQVNA
ncbi:MAG: acyl-CoA thioesterase [Candidatus Eremiobacteraeota bacterium]|nr:acyl-CoA thioesterase [Candidatus Eremiobacteraeota bacterium]